MDPVAATATFYGVETLVEGAVAGYIVTQPSLPLKARLRHVASGKPLPRASHSLAVVGTSALLFGGNTSEDRVASNSVEILELPTEEGTVAEVRSVAASSQTDAESPSPSARRSHSAVSARNRMFVFGGQPGRHEPPLNEKGRVWVFDPQQASWTYLDPPPGTDYPVARSHHSSTASDDGDAIFIHGGSTSGNGDGELLADTWAFFLDQGKWTQLPDAPGPARRDSSIAYAQGSLWRFGGFDGETALGGQLDSLEVRPPHSEGTADDDAVPPTTDPEIASEWKSVAFEPETKGEGASGAAVPGPRSLAALRHVSTGKGRHYLLLALGAGDGLPSKTGGEDGVHYLHDIWAYQLPSPILTGAGVKDAIREKLPKMESNEGQWAPVEITGISVGPDENSGGKWTGRAWFDAAATGSKQFMVWGGIDDRNEVLGDGWVLMIE